MGASFSQPFPSLDKCTKGGENDRISYATSAMQGRAETMTDAVSILLVLKIIERIALHKYMLDLLVIWVKH